MTTNKQTNAAKWAVLATFGCNGLVMSSWLSRVPDVKAELGLTPGQLGTVLLAISIGALIGLPSAGRITARIGATKTVRIGILLAAPGAVLAGIGVEWVGSAYLTAAALVLVGLGNGIWDVAQNVEGAAVELAMGRTYMPTFHAAFSGGTVLGALIGAAATWGNVPILVHLGVVVPLAGLATWLVGRYFLPAKTDAVEDVAAPVGRSAWLEPRTILVGFIALAAAFTEGTANDWLAVAFVDGHNLPNSQGVIALAVFLTFMTAGRLIGPSIIDRYGRVVVLRVLFGAAILGCGLVVFGNVWVAYLGCAIWGLGASLGFPVAMSAAADDPARSARRISVVSTIGYMAFLAGPPLLGFLGDQVGVLHALLVVGALSLIAMLLVPSSCPTPSRLEQHGNYLLEHQIIR